MKLPLWLYRLRYGSNLRWEDGFDRMTMEQARFIRSLRCEEPARSWRGVAMAASGHYGGGWGSNQIAGMDLCRKAAKMHGEHHMEPPWN